MASPSNYFLSNHAANESGYRTKKLNIPFYAQDSDDIKVTLKYDRFTGDSQSAKDQAFQAKMGNIKARTINRLILHYFPEYYIYYRTFARNKSRAFSSGTVAEMTYRRLRDSIVDNITAVYYRPANPAINPTKDIVLASFTGFIFE